MNNQTLFFDKDIDITPIKNKKIGIIGYGNQGRAQALNLRDYGVSIKVGVRSIDSIEKDLLKSDIVYDSIENVSSWANLICILVSDASIPEVFNSKIKSHLNENDTILFSHGYNVTYNLIKPPENVDVIMVAPSGGGQMVRDEYKKGSGVPALLAIDQNYSGDALDTAKAYSKAIGSARVCSFLSTFKEETETDLFGEQSLLTGALPMMIEKSLKVLLEDGYSPTVAWFVCYYEIKMIVDLFHEKGFGYLYNAISDTARFGGLKSGNYLIDDEYENKLKNILSDIKNGNFVKDLKANVDTLKYKSSIDSKSSDEISKIMNVLFEKTKKGN
tara:strand:+ start:1521 stop:2510 length:990 start_codon:yes stop_codon:yes gene_type:complete